MPAGKHGSSEITISYDDAAGAPVTVTCGVLTMGPVKVTANQQVATSFCDTVAKMLPTGMSKIDPIKLTGFFDDTPATGAHHVFGTPDTSPTASTRTLTIDFGNGQTWTSEGYLTSYAVIANQGNLTGYEADLCQNSGAWSPVP
jgi:hypothetical protein